MNNTIQNIQQAASAVIATKDGKSKAQRLCLLLVYAQRNESGEAKATIDAMFSKGGEYHDLRQHKSRAARVIRAEGRTVTLKDGGKVDIAAMLQSIDAQQFDSVPSVVAVYNALNAEDKPVETPESQAAEWLAAGRKAAGYGPNEAIPDALKDSVIAQGRAIVEAKAIEKLNLSEPQRLAKVVALLPSLAPESLAELASMIAKLQSEAQAA